MPLSLRRLSLSLLLFAIASGAAALNVGEGRTAQQRRLAELRPAEVSAMMVEQAQVDAAAARVQLEAARVDLAAGERSREELASALADIERQLQAQPAAAASGEAVARKREELDKLYEQKRQQSAQESARLGARQAALAEAQARLELAREWHEALQELFRIGQEQSQQIALEDLEARLERERRHWRGEAQRLRLALDAAVGDDLAGQRMRLDMAEERARLAGQRLRLAQIEAQLEGIEALGLVPEGDAEALRGAAERLSGLRRELRGQGDLVQRRLAVLEQQRELAARRGDGDAGRDAERLAAALRGYQRAVGLLLERIAERPEQLQRAYAESVRRGLSDRRPLPADLLGWQALAHELGALPGRLGEAARAGAGQLREQFAAFDADRWLTLLLIEGVWLALGWRALVRLRRWLALREVGRGSFGGDLLLVAGQPLRRTAPLLLLGGGALLVLPVAAAGGGWVPLAGPLLATGLAAVLAVNLAWSLLAGPHLPPERRQPRLYRQLRATVGGGAVLGLVVYWAHGAELAPLLLNLLDRTLMLFLLLVALPLMELRRLLLTQLSARLGEGYWLRLLGMFTLLLPLAMVGAALVGTAGYVNLAWSIAGWLSSLLLAFGAWLVAGRLWGEVCTRLRRCGGGDEGGPLWSEGLVAPLHRLGQLALLAGAAVLPLWLHGLGSDAPQLQLLGRLLQARLFTLGSTDVTVAGMGVALLLLLVAVRAGRWLRTLAYHWALARVQDHGVRHSLSVLAQYVFVSLTVLASLRLAGIDLTTLAIFAGALGVGIGFGLQSLANNFISGLLLLIERPLRARDIVRIGEHEGEVTHIGMRTLTVRTWDNEEVILPNSEVTSHPFTNWTRSDNVLRTVVKVAVSHDADLRLAKEVIERELRAHPAVLARPEPDVWLEAFGDFSITFHVQYFIDLARHGRLEVRSQLLLSIWDALRAARIRVPYPQLDVRMSGLQAQAAVLGRSAA